MIVKRAFLEGRVCPTWGWFGVHLAAAPITPAQEWRFRIGREVESAARTLLGKGQVLAMTPLEKATAESLAAVHDADSSLLYEVTVRWNQYVARADAMRRHQAGWEVIEFRVYADLSGPRDELESRIAALGAAGRARAKAESCAEIVAVK